MTRGPEEEAAALASTLATLVEGEPPALQSLLPRIGRLVGAETAAACGLAPGIEGPALAFAHGPPELLAGAVDRLRALLRARPDDWGLFDPGRPDPRQCNLVLTSAELRRLGDLSSVPVFRHFLPAVGLGGLEEIRVLLCDCDGPGPVTWVGGFRRRPFGERERALLQRLVPALRRRQAVERLLGGAPVALYALSAMLEALGAPAFVLGPCGSIEHANAAGRGLLDRDQAAVLSRLRESVAEQGGGDFRVTRLETPGMAPLRLAVLRSTRLDLSLRLEAAGARWGLTPKQREVLSHLSRGECNKSIAAGLGCSEATVELHVSALLEKADCERRAELVARFWTEC